MKYTRSSIIDYFLQLFTLPKVRDEITACARTFMSTTARLTAGLQSEASRFTTGIKGEAIETKDAFLILAKYMRKEKLSRREKRQFKLQMIDILKSAGVVVPVMLIPLPFVSTILLIMMDQLLQSMNIQILPSSFYKQEKQGLMTREGVEADLKK